MTRERPFGSRQTSVSEARSLLRFQYDVEHMLQRAEEWNFRQRCRQANLNYNPRRVFKPNLQQLKALSREIRGLPKRRRLSAGQARIYIRTLQQLRRRQERLEFLVAKALHRQAEIASRVRK